MGNVQRQHTDLAVKMSRFKMVILRQKKSYNDCILLRQSYGPPTVMAPSPCGLCMEAAQAPYDFHAEPAETA